MLSRPKSYWITVQWWVLCCVLLIRVCELQFNSRWSQWNGNTFKQAKELLLSAQENCCCYCRRWLGKREGTTAVKTKQNKERPIKRVDFGPLYSARVSYCRKTKHKTSLASRFIDHCCRTRRGVNHCVSSLVNIRAPPALARNRVVELNLSNVTSFDHRLDIYTSFPSHGILII